MKILAKTLAHRLETVLPDIISPDKAEFVRNRHSFFNLHRLFNILYSQPSQALEEVVSFDAEKPFDRVE